MRSPSRALPVPAGWLFRVGAFAALLGASACTDTKSEIKSETPRVTSERSAETDAGLLLSESGVRPLYGSEELVVQDISDVPVFENPDPRGPCGGPSPPLPLTGAVGRSFTASSGAFVVELLVPVSAESQAYFEAQRRNSSGPCDPFESRTNTGATQSVSEIEIIDLSSIDAQAVGSTSTVAVGPAEAQFGGFLIDSADYLIAVQFQGPSRPSERNLVDLAERAAARVQA